MFRERGWPNIPKAFGVLLMRPTCLHIFSWSGNNMTISGNTLQWWATFYWDEISAQFCHTSKTIKLLLSQYKYQITIRSNISFVLKSKCVPLSKRSIIWKHTCKKIENITDLVSTSDLDRISNSSDFFYAIASLQTQQQFCSQGFQQEFHAILSFKEMQGESRNGTRMVKTYNEIQS